MNLLREFLHRPVNVLKVKWKHRKTLDAFEKQIAEAKAKHRAVRHLERARQDYMNDCLRGGR